ncbi:hypothetical protein EBN03_13730 [Nocardia stercoris]|uniref:Rv3651-like N-terminal domain-containing protein n=2 Tax=Nocardia stercoris TaxID=2483361 RepID=A0A3M2L5M5_9NOCA|nr:hypothetical protein EBN03_13730 [Nocardia stercoris]
MSVVSVGVAARDFAGWQRVLQRQLAKTPALYDGTSTATIAELLSSVHQRAESIDRIIGTRSGPHRIVARPVFGPTADVHAVQLWLGPAAGGPPDPPAAVGAVWDLASQTMSVPVGSTRLPGIAVTDYSPRMSIAELFHRISAFDRHAEVLDLLYDPHPEDRISFDATVTDGPGRWRVSIRGRHGADGSRGAWCLIEDVTPAEMPAQWPGLEWVGLREAHRRAGTHLAIVQLEHANIAHWLTDPAPWIRWDHLNRPADVFHADDRGRLTELADSLRTVDTAGVTVRTLNDSGGHSPTAMVIYPYPGFSNRPLAIAQFLRVADR